MAPRGRTTAKLVVVAIGILGGCGDVGESGSRPDSLSSGPSTKSNAQQSPGANVALIGATTIRLTACRFTVRANDRSAESHADIPLPGACRFVLDAGGKPQTVATPRGPTLLVMSSAPLPDGRLCDTRVRAVVVRNHGVSVSEGEQRIRSCASGPFDTKMFHVLAESVKAS